MYRKWVPIFPVIIVILLVLIVVIVPLDIFMGIDHELPGYGYHLLAIYFCGSGFLYLRRWLWETFKWFRNLQDFHVNISTLVLSIILPLVISLILNSFDVSFSGPVWYVTLVHYIVKFFFGYFIAFGKEWWIDTYKPHWR